MKVKAEMELRLKSVNAYFMHDKLVELWATVELYPAGNWNPLPTIEQKLRITPKQEEADELFKLLRGRIPLELDPGKHTIKVPPDDRDCVSMDEVYRVKSAFENAMLDPDAAPGAEPMRLMRYVGHSFAEEVECWLKKFCQHQRGLLLARVQKVRDEYEQKLCTCAEYAGKSRYTTFVAMWWTARDEQEFNKQVAEVRAAGGRLIDKELFQKTGRIHWQFVIPPEVAKAKWGSTEEDFLEIK